MGNTYSNIHLYKTNPKTQNIAPIAKDENRMSLSNLTPPLPNDVPNSYIQVKTNGGMYDTPSGNLLGFYYFIDEPTVYVNGEAFNGVNNIPNGSIMFTDKQFYPSFCVKLDGSASIRWFINKAALLDAVPFCRYIFPGGHPLVFNGQNIFTTPIEVDGAPIFNINNPGSTADHFNTTFGNYSYAELRTLVGHKPDGTYLLVCADDGGEMPLRMAADLMCDLGCDFAVHMDGSSPVQMVLRNNYPSTVNSYTKVTSNGGTQVPTAICAYYKWSRYDINGDGVADNSDQQIIINNLGQPSTASAVAEKCDLNHDGYVEVADLSIMMAVIAAQQ
jgi:hypothetical protein